ncbi:hypothetical protein [Pseudoxanthomonas daejeonensis]|uniref:hypothetical protein n=1 Tax=Pseudoxanthomonas daejeonensis TaxID=266062 RepID=UPI003CE4D1B9
MKISPTPQLFAPAAELRAPTLMKFCPTSELFSPTAEPAAPTMVKICPTPELFAPRVRQKAPILWITRACGPFHTTPGQGSTSSGERVPFTAPPAAAGRCTGSTGRRRPRRTGRTATWPARSSPG